MFYDKNQKQNLGSSLHVLATQKPQVRKSFVL